MFWSEFSGISFVSKEGTPVNLKRGQGYTEYSSMKIMLGLYISRDDRLAVVHRNIFNFLQVLVFYFINSLLQTSIMIPIFLPSGDQTMYGQQVNGRKENPIFYKNGIAFPAYQNTLDPCGIMNFPRSPGKSYNTFSEGVGWSHCFKHNPSIR